MVVLAVVFAASCDGDDGEPAGRLTVRCDADGIALSAARATASPDGVHIDVDNTTGAEVRLVVSPAQENPTITVAPGRSTVVMLARPGPVRLRCDSGPNQASRTTTVTVDDPGRFYRAVDLVAALGCAPNVSVNSHEFGWGDTPTAAAEDLTAGLEGDVTLEPGNGYRDHWRHEFLLWIDGRGQGTLDVYPDRHPDGAMRYRATHKDLCPGRLFAPQG